MDRDLFYYHLPQDRIAKYPCDNPEDARLLIGIHQMPLQESLMKDFLQWVHADDLLVFNNTKVWHAQLQGYRESGGKLSILVTHILGPWKMRALIKSSQRLHPGEICELVSPHHPKEKMGEKVRILQALDDGLYEMAFLDPPPQGIESWLMKVGLIPLPPYLKRKADPLDSIRYQTLFAKQGGSVAAPTAGLHFSPMHLQTIQSRNLHCAEVTLHIGMGTFQPIRTQNIDDHKMHAEAFWVPKETEQAIFDCKKRGGRVIAIGTTTLRALEAWRQEKRSNGETRLFIRPGFSFQIVDALLTNFHMPASSLAVLVGAFVGVERFQKMYRYALDHHYRFLSYGDAMFLTRTTTSEDAVL